jgi:environmental stress-induced protein Ves
VIRESTLPQIPWKNGGGLTREILRHPPEPQPFDWRLSLATIDRPGAFSAFAGYDRTLVLVRGDGVNLTFGSSGHSCLASPGACVAFDGACPTVCTLPGGPSSDLNLIVSRERAESVSRSVPVRRSTLIRTAEWSETLVCCVSGVIQVIASAGGMETLGAVDVARCSATDGILTCGPVGAQPAHLFVAHVRSR